MKRTCHTLLPLGFALAFAVAASGQADDRLPSWNDGKAKQSIIDFVATVTKAGSPDFVPAGPSRVDSPVEVKR